MGSKEQEIVDEDDEQFWDKSQKGMSFNDVDEFDSNAKLFVASSSKTASSSYVTSSITDTIFKDVPIRKNKTEQQKPLTALMTPRSLALVLQNDIDINKRSAKLSLEDEVILLRRQVENHWRPEPVEKTIKKMILQQPYTLEWYRTYDLKSELLNKAVESGDGNAILTVILFLSKTLNQKLFFRLIKDQPTAVSHYVKYLSTRCEMNTLIDILTMLGQTKDVDMKYFEYCVTSTDNIKVKLSRLASCLKNHFQDSKDRRFVDGFVQLIEWQLKYIPNSPSNIVKPSLTCLAYACKNHWSDSKESLTSPFKLCQEQKIAEKQLQWTILSVRSSMKCWDDLETRFITKSWIGSKKLNSVVPIEKFIMELHKKEAPGHVLSNFLHLIDNLERRLELAKDLSCHKVAIDVYMATKDKQGLTEYKANLDPQSEFWIYAETAVRTLK